MKPEELVGWLEKIAGKLDEVSEQQVSLKATVEARNEQRENEIKAIFATLREHDKRIRSLELRLAMYVGMAVVMGTIIGGLINAGVSYAIKAWT